MDYGALVNRSFQITWRHKYLWVLGLLAGSGAQTCSGGNFNVPASFPETGDVPSPSPDELGDVAAEVAGQFVQFLAEYWPVLLLALVILGIIALVFWVLSLISQAGLIAAVGRIEAGEQVSLGRAWHSGVSIFWRFLGLWLIAIGLAIAVAAVVGVVIFTTVVAAGVAGEEPTGRMVVLLVLLGTLGILLLIPVAIVVSIIFAFAQRAVAVDGYGSIAAIGRGWEVFRSRLGDTLLTWVIGVAMLIAAGIGVVIVLAFPAIPLALFVVGLVMTVGLNTTTIIAIGSAVLLLLLLAVVVSSPVNTFFWTYWTLAYLRLTGR